jgi:hypothetical protein
MYGSFLFLAVWDVDYINEAFCGTYCETVTMVTKQNEFSGVFSILCTLYTVLRSVCEFMRQQRI